MATDTSPIGRRPTSQTVFGVGVVLLGIVLLLDTTGAYDTGFLLRYAPSLFVVAGGYALVASGFRNLAGPLVVMLVAGAAQVAALDLVAVDDLAQFWPLLVVAFGLSVVLGRVRSRAESVGDQYVSATALFGSVEKRATSSSFGGGDLTALFGGAELDLRDAEVDQRPAHVSATALFGGVDVIVPREWNVRLDVLPVFGAAEDERPRREGEHEDVDLVVTGFVAFGAVSLDD